MIFLEINATWTNASSKQRCLMNMAKTSTSRSQHDFNAPTRAWPWNLHVFALEITTTFQSKEALLSPGVGNRAEASGVYHKAFSAA